MNLIVNADKNWAIGKDGRLLVNIPADMKFFKETTTGNVVVMGFNTFNSLPNKKPLLNRINIVLCPKGVKIDGCITVHGADELFSKLKEYDSQKIFVIGGASTYSLLLPYCESVLVTKVDAVGGADVFFENLDKNKNFELVFKSEPVLTNGLNIVFTEYKNNAVKPF